MITCQVLFANWIGRHLPGGTEHHAHYVGAAAASGLNWRFLARMRHELRHFDAVQTYGRELFCPQTFWVKMNASNVVHRRLSKLNQHGSDIHAVDTQFSWVSQLTSMKREIDLDWKQSTQSSQEHKVGIHSQWSALNISCYAWELNVMSLQPKQKSHFHITISP